MTFDKRVLVQANVSLYHATNLGGFARYVGNGAVMCREDLLANDPDATPFASDPNDRQHNLLGRVFGNLADFGEVYARAYQRLATPNIYGPIQIRFPPSIWTTLSDVVLTERSIMYLGSTWRNQGIQGQRLNNLVAGCDGAGVPTHPFGLTEASAVDRSIPLSACSEVIVEPIRLQGHSLPDVVRAWLSPLGLAHLVRERSYTADASVTRLQAQIDWLFATQHIPSPGVSYDPPLSWMAGAKSGIVRRWGQWATYFFRDTVEYVRRTAGWATSPAGASSGWHSTSMGEYDFDEHAAFVAFQGDCEALGESPCVDEIVDVFMRHFEDPAQGVPYCSAEGGYQYFFGGPYDVDEVLRDALPDDELSEVVEAAISRLQGESPEWVFAHQY